MAVISPEDFILKVSATSSGTFTVVGNATNAGRANARQTNRRKLLGGNELVFAQSADRTLSASGVTDESDAGLTIIRNASESGDAIWVQWLPDGVAGKAYKVVVSNFSEDIAGDGDAMEWSADFEAEGAPTTVSGT